MNKQLWLVRCLIASHYSTGALLTPYLPLYFSSRGFTPIEIGLFMMLGPFTAMFAQPFWGYISDRLKTVKNVIVILWILSVLSSIMLFLSEGFAMTLLSVSLLFLLYRPFLTIVRCCFDTGSNAGPHELRIDSIMGLGFFRGRRRGCRRHSHFNWRR